MLNQNGYRTQAVVIFLSFMLITLVYVVLRFNLIEIPMNRDEGGFAYFGRLLAQGGTLYQDGFDHKPPGIWMIYACLSYIVPFTATGLHIAVQGYNFLTLVSLGLLTLKLFGARASLWALLIYAVVSSGREVEGFSASAEMFMLLPMTASFLFCVIGVRKNLYYPFFIGGVLSAAAFWIKQPALAVTFFVIVYMAFESFPVLRFRIIFSRLFWFVFGFCVISAILLVYFYYKGVWDEFVYWSFTHSMQYASSHSLGSIIESLGSRMAHLIRSNPFPWFFACVACLVILFKRFKDGLICAGYLLSSLAAAAHSPYMYTHYFALLCPALSLAGGVGAASVLKRIKNDSALKPILVVMVFVLITGIPSYLNKDYYILNNPIQNSRLLFGPNPFPESIEIAGFIQNNTKPSDSNLIVGSEPQILVLADRPSATRHLFFYQMTGAYKRSPEFQRQFFYDIENRKPHYVVWIKIYTSWMPDLNTKYSESFRGFLNELKEIIDRDYEIEAAFMPNSLSGKIVRAKGKNKSNKDNLLKASLIEIYKRIERQPPVMAGMNAIIGHSAPHAP